MTIDKLRGKLGKVRRDVVVLGDVECPVSHHHAPGVYCREIFMPAGTFVIGHKHKTEHLNVMITGRARVLMEGLVTEIKAPFTFRSHAGVQKVLYILEDTTWMTVHATAEKDLEKITDQVVDKAASIRLCNVQMKLLLEGKL